MSSFRLTGGYPLQTNGAVLFVSIHYNSSPSPDAHGIEIFYHSGSDHKRVQQSKELGNLVLTELIDQTHALSRGVKNGNFHVIRETQCRLS